MMKSLPVCLRLGLLKQFGIAWRKQWEEEESGMDAGTAMSMRAASFS
jgi:hypothetical protein